MTKKAVGGRPSLYSPKDGKVQVRALTTTGARILNTARTVVKKLSKWRTVSDGDVIDYILRCWYSGRDVADAEVAEKREK